MQKDGKILVGGYSGNDPAIRFALARFNPDGSLDTTFNGTGKVTTAIRGPVDVGQGIVIQDDGKIVVGGYSAANHGYDYAVVRYNSDGTLDSSFGTGGTVTTQIGSAHNFATSTLLQKDGKIVLAGFSIAYYGSPDLQDFCVVRYDQNGVLDPTFHGSGIVTTPIGSTSDDGYASALQKDGKIILAGDSLNSSNYDFAIVRYTTDGSLDPTFNGNGKVTTAIGSGDDSARAVAIQDDGYIVAAGVTNNGSNNDFAVVRYKPDGTLDTTFNNTGKAITAIGTGDDTVRSVAIQSDGKIVVIGTSFNGSKNTFALVRYNTDGSLDTTFGVAGKVSTIASNGDDQAASVALQSDGKIVVAGRSANANDSDFSLARYLVSAPIATTTAATAPTTSGATLNGTVNPNGGITTAAFEYGLTTSYGSLVSIAPAPGSGGQDVVVSATISGLLPNQTYHYRLTATNAVDTNHGADMTFMTGAKPPIVTTGAASNVTAGGAMISGTVNPNGSATTSAVVEYGLDTIYGTSVSVTPNPGNGTLAVSVSAALNGLQSNQTYHFRVSATTQDGGTVTGVDATFMTGATAPGITTGGATPDVNGTEATLGGTVNPNGSATTAVFEYGLTTSYGNIVIAAPNPGNGASPINVSAMIGGLTPNRAYHYRLTGTNAGGAVSGNDVTFMTPDVLPIVITQPATGPTHTSVTLHGTVNPNGSNTMVHFSYGPAGTPLNFSTDPIDIGNGSSVIPINVIVTGLAPFANYQFRLEADTDNGGTTRGDVLDFQTKLTTLAALPDRAFAALGDPPFNIDVLANDIGDGLSITELTPPARATGNGVVINGLQLNFQPLDIAQTNATSETFSYQVSDAGQNTAQADVTVYYFLTLRGTYFGSFSDVNGRVLHFQLDLDYAGLASGRLDWDDQQYPFKVQFDASGHAQIVKARSSENKVTLVADLQIDPLSPNMTLAFRDSGPAPAMLGGTLQLLPAILNAMPQQGLQIGFIDLGEEGVGGAASAAAASAAAGIGSAATSRPEGIGFTQLRVTGTGHKRQGRFVTVMPDFGVFSVGKPLTPTDELALPRYNLGVQSYRRSGSLLGAVSGTAFASLASQSNKQFDRTSGSLGWQRILPNGGIENLLASVEGYPYQTGTHGLPFGFDSVKNPNARVRLHGAGLQRPDGTDYEFQILIKNKKGVTAATASSNDMSLGLSLQFNLAAGLFTGTFQIPGAPGKAPEKVKIMGALGFEPDIFVRTTASQTPQAAQQTRVQGSFFIKSSKRTGSIKITPL